MVGRRLVFWILLLFEAMGPSISPIVIDGTQNIYVFPHNYVFYDGDLVKGFVRFGDGFTVIPHISHPSNMYFDACVSVSGGIDLRGTSTLTLLCDLKLDSDITFTQSGSLHAYGAHIVLGGDMSIADNQHLLCKGQLVIDGNGHTLTLHPHAQLCLDSECTLTLRNITVRTIRDSYTNPAVQLAATTSKLALDNVTFALGGDFFLRNGQLFMHDVRVTGTSTFGYLSAMPSYIPPFGSLYFDYGTTFSYAPASSDRDLIVMSDVSSRLTLNGASLVTTATGIRLTTGSLFLDNNVHLTSDNLATLSNCITFGNSELGVLADLNIHCLGSAHIDVSGLINHDAAVGV